MDYDQVEILRRDCLGRVTVSPAQREAILDAFEGSGLKGVGFAKLVGVNYQTFASWVQKRRRARGAYPALEVAPPPVATQVQDSSTEPAHAAETQHSPLASPSHRHPTHCAPEVQWIELTLPEVVEVVPAPSAPEVSSSRDLPQRSDGDALRSLPSPPGPGLCISLPCGAQMIIDHVGQAGIAAALLKALQS